MVIRIECSSGGVENRELQLIALDRGHHLALLKQVVPDKLPASLELGPDAFLREGAGVLMLGFPLAGALGFSLIARRGMIAAVTPIAVQGQ